MSDDQDPPLDYALQVRNNRWRLTVGLPSMTEAAAVVARIASGADAVKVAVEVYDPIKDAYERKDYLTFAGQRPASAKAALKPLGREIRRLSVTIKIAAAAVIIPLLGLALLGAHGLTVSRPQPVAGPPRTEEIVIPPPSRALPRDWVAARQQREIPWVFRGAWAVDCATARLDGTGVMTVSAETLFGQPVNWLRVIGSRLLVNTGRDGESTSTQIRSDGLALFLEDRFVERVQSGMERVPYSPEKPAILSKCL